MTSFAESSGIVVEVEGGGGGGRTSARESRATSIGTPAEWVWLIPARYGKRRQRARILSTGVTMRTRRNRSMVSVASEVSGITFAVLLVTGLGVAACAGRQHAIAQTERVERAENTENAMNGERRTDVLQFENQATTYVDVYLASRSGHLQWRLGRVPPGFRAELRVPQSAIDQASGFVELAVIAGSPLSAEVWRDPRAVIAIAQPISQVVSQRWTFRQPASLPLQLEATWLRRPR